MLSRQLGLKIVPITRKEKYHRFSASSDLTQELNIAKLHFSDHSFPYCRPTKFILMKRKNVQSS